MQSLESFNVLFLGVISALSIVIKTVAMKFRFSPIPGYIIFGLLARQFTENLNFASETLYGIVSVFGDIGLILILFQVGVQSNLQSLLRQIRNAIFISVFEVIVSGIFVFAVLYFFFEIALPVALLLSIAFVATSIALSVGPWQDAGALKSKAGQLLLDLSALDDIAGITLMVIAFSFIHSVSEAGAQTVFWELFISLFFTLAKLSFLIVLAYSFSVYLEPRFSKLIERFEIVPDPVVTIICLALMFSGLAGYLGLSIALGSFLIGLSFSRDKEAVKLLASYLSLESFFIPFFFFSVGYSASEISSVSLFTMAILFLPVMLGKLIGVALPSLLVNIPLRTSLLLGLSMVPRAEVTLVVINFAKTTLRIPSSLYTNSIMVILVTCFVPLILKPLFPLPRKGVRQGDFI